MNEQEEFVPVTKEDGELQTNMHGDVSVGQKHFLEISFDGFRICETTTDDMPLEEFNNQVLNFWKKLDTFLQKSIESKMKKKSKMERSNSYVG